MMPDRSSQRGVLEFDFQEDVQGIAFYCDVWQDGQCIASTPQLRASSTAQIEALVVSQEMEDSLCRWGVCGEEFRRILHIGDCFGTGGPYKERRLWV